MSESATIKQLLEDNFNWDERTDLDAVLATIEQLVLEHLIGDDPDEKHELRRIGWDWNPWRHAYTLEQGNTELTRVNAAILDKNLKGHRENRRRALNRLIGGKE